MKPCIAYLGGAGGNWLSATICRLEIGDFEETLRPNSLGNFHDHKKTKHINISHFDNLHLSSTAILSTHKIFSSNYAGWIKANKVEALLGLLITEQIFILSNSFRALFDPFGRYRKRITLDVNWLFYDPDQYIDTLFLLLRTWNISFIENRDFMYKSIKSYVESTPDVRQIIDNSSSYFWVGWCHALSMYYNIPIKKNLLECTSVDEIYDHLKEHKNLFVDEALKHIYDYEYQDFCSD